MLKLIDNLWIGNAVDEGKAKFMPVGVTALLNVAQDLRAGHGWDDGVEYMQVGLIDGPGNLLVSYYAAILAVNSLIQNHQLMIYSHGESRSLAVALMYLSAISRHGWDELLVMLQERVEETLPEVHEAHKTAFNKLDWRSLVKIMVKV